MVLIGYARVSTADQSLDRQRDELTAAGCEIVYEETASGKKNAKRPVWDEALRSLRRDDTLVVTELSRLGRSSAELGALADELGDRDVYLRILTLDADTRTAQGKLIYSIFAAVAESERAVILERTMSGLAASRARGRKGGRKPVMTPASIRRAQAMYDTKTHSMAEIASAVNVSRQTLYRYLTLDKHSESEPSK